MEKTCTELLQTLLKEYSEYTSQTCVYMCNVKCVEPIIIIITIIIIIIIINKEG